MYGVENFLELSYVTSYITQIYLLSFNVHMYINKHSYRPDSQNAT